MKEKLAQEATASVESPHTCNTTQKQCSNPKFPARRVVNEWTLFQRAKKSLGLVEDQGLYYTKWYRGAMSMCTHSLCPPGHFGVTEGAREPCVPPSVTHHAPLHVCQPKIKEEFDSPATTCTQA